MKKFLISIGITILVVGLITVSIYIKFNKPYSEIISINWSIKLPNQYKVIYSKDSGASFQGDGVRYHTFEYKNEDDISLALRWENGKNDTIESRIKQVLYSLNISNENMPKFQNEYKYYSQKKKDSSEIYLIFVTETKMLYVIEDIL